MIEKYKFADSETVNETVYIYQDEIKKIVYV